jgi:hypothetical protein
VGLENYIDLDGLIGLVPQGDVKVCGSQNGYHYSGLAYVLTGDVGYMEAVSDAFDKFGYFRNSVTNDKVSYDDLHVMCAYIKLVRMDFWSNLFWHPAKESWAIRWWFIRSPVFVVNVLFPFRKSIIRDLTIWFTDITGKADADAYKGAFLVSELYPCREYAKNKLRQRALKRWSMHLAYGGITHAFAEYFPDGHPFVELSWEFERRRNENIKSP